MRFYEYPRELWPYLGSSNLMGRFIREVRRGLLREANILRMLQERYAPRTQTLSQNP